jgi:hypothetical protein
MSKLGLMVERCVDPVSMPVLVDLGYVKENVSRDRADKLIAAGVAPRNFSIEGFGRLLVKLPPRKANAIFAKFRQIVPGSTYWQTTHHWHDPHPATRSGGE